MLVFNIVFSDIIILQNRRSYFSKKTDCGFGGNGVMSILLAWIIITVAILLAAYLIPGIKVESLGAAIIGAAILGLLNALIKPILIVLTFPITLLTLGLFIFVINALLFWLAGSIIRGFSCPVIRLRIIRIVRCNHYYLYCTAVYRSIRTGTRTSH